MKQEKYPINLTQKVFIILMLTFSLNGYSQFITICGDVFHGVGHAHQDCVEDIIITSTEAEGPEGTIFAGVIYSEGKVTITPGFSKVRILYQYYAGTPSTGETHTHRTTVGNGGDPGGRYASPNNDKPKTLTIYPNPLISNLTVTTPNSTVIKYEVYSNDGRLLLDNNIKKTSTSHNINLKQLKSGLHLLKLYLKDGAIITKQIIKQ